ncbi:MAG: radical SAM protein [Candidatus Altiarchaeota archaeon]
MLAAKAEDLFRNSSLNELLSHAWRTRKINFPDSIDFYAPGFIHYNVGGYSNRSEDFPAISITGNACALDCDHCGKQLLGEMLPARTPKKLRELILTLSASSAKGVLVSGGADATGKVPLNKFLPTLKEIKEETDLLLAVHTGLVDKETAQGLASSGVDVALIDVLGDGETIKRIYHLDTPASSYLDLLLHLKDAGVKTAPHIVMGLNYGLWSGEFQALEFIAKAKSEVLVLVGLMPFSGTPMDSTKPPSADAMAKFVAVARIVMPKIPIVLGCARPRQHKHILDPLSIEAGVNAVAHPAREAHEKAKELGLAIDFKTVCCAEYALKV